MTAFDRFVPGIIERHTVKHHREDDGKILGDAGSPECVKSIPEPALLGGEKAFKKKEN